MAGRIAGAVLRGIGKVFVVLSIVTAMTAGALFALADYAGRK